MLRFLRRRLPLIGRWPRLCAAGICAVLAATSALGAQRAAGSVPVVVAVRALPAGHLVTARDVTVHRWPARLRPARARADPGELVGRRLAGPIAANEPVTTTRLLGRDLTTGLGRGTVATPIVLDDGHAGDLVHPGDRVDVLATPRPVDPAIRSASDDVTVLASHVLVLAVLNGSTDSAGIDGAEIIVATTRDIATRITRVRSSQMFAVLGDSS